LAVAVVGAIIFTAALSPRDKNDDTTQDIVITDGMNRAAIAQSLAEADIIKNQTAFTIYSRFVGGNILPGTYEFSPSESGSDIANQLASGKFKTTNITIIEGWRSTDIETYLVNEKKLPQMKGFAAQASQYEGYLFPDTYEIKIDETIPDLIQLMRDNFTKRTKDLAVNPEVVIMASIIEREAKDDADRPKIAAVYINRLKIGMRLQADPTVQYAKGNWKAVTVDDYTSVISPYNTYLNDGLPPGPICNPGLKSIQAVLTPDSNNYLYFFSAQGQTYFSKTLEEHQAKVKQYF